ncbi:MAG: hypothetical protein K9N23_10585 [Akkermansiaceae bacterium]|nr:hypothetical protein [Akkermansiaceae bacterium]
MQSITPPPSTPAPSEVSIIRTGRDGRLRFTPEQRQELLAASEPRPNRIPRSNRWPGITQWVG